MENKVQECHKQMVVLMEFLKERRRKDSLDRGEIES